MNQMMLAKSYLKKAYVWVKNHWYVPVGAFFALVTWFFYRQKSAAIVENLRETRISHKKEIKEIDKIHEKQIADRDKALNTFKESEDKTEFDNRKKIKDSLAKFSERKKSIKEKEIHDIADELARVVRERKK